MDKLIVLMAALALAASAAAQQYKWIDQDGKVEYGDTPPPGADATRLHPPAVAPQPPAPGQDALTPEAAFQKRQHERREQEEKAAKERAAADARRLNCAQAQSSLRQLQSGQRITSMNAAGEHIFLDGEQRARESERAQQSVSEWCGPS